MDRSFTVIFIIIAGLIVGVGFGAVLQYGVPMPGGGESVDAAVQDGLLVRYDGEDLSRAGLANTAGSGHELRTEEGVIGDGLTGGGINLAAGEARIEDPIDFSGDSMAIAFWTRTSNRTDSRNTVFELKAAEQSPGEAYPRMKGRGPAPGREIGWRIWGSTEDQVSGLQTSRTDWDTGEWYHVTFQISPVPQSEGVWQHAIFIDGRPAAFGEQEFPPRLDNGGLYLGSENASIGYGGVIDDFRVYDRALSSNEVERIMKDSS